MVFRQRPTAADDSRSQESVRFTTWLAEETLTAQSSPSLVNANQVLRPLIQGGPARWNQKITTTATIDSDTGPYATDFLTAPEGNPWLAQVRFTGLDFFADGGWPCVRGMATSGSSMDC